MAKKIFWMSVFLLLSGADMVSARGGGGGSGGGGGGGGGFHGGGFGGSSRQGWGEADTARGLWTAFIMGSLFLGLAAYLAYRRKKQLAIVKGVINLAGSQDGAWQEDALKKRVAEVFYAFQKDWSDFNVESMKSYLAEDFYKKMVLELNVLKSEGRRNAVDDPKLNRIEFIEAVDQADNAKDRFTAEINAQAHDRLLETSTEQVLYLDTSSFTEYWHFCRSGNDWVLESIGQATADGMMEESQINAFAQKNGFYYDPDFGWLMMPNKGAIFNQTNFKTSDINNHVIGYFREKIVEFYTYIPVPNQNNYVVAQAVLPKTYHDILVRKKGGFSLFGPANLKRIKTESNDFDQKFELWAHLDDQATSFELLAPNFMAKVYDLPFELNIEVVGNFLYLYAKSRTGIDYDQMLEVLSWAFDEMKM